MIDKKSGRLFKHRWETGGGTVGRWILRNGGTWEIGPTNRWEVGPQNRWEMGGWDPVTTPSMLYGLNKLCSVILLTYLLSPLRARWHIRHQQESATAVGLQPIWWWCSMSGLILSSPPLFVSMFLLGDHVSFFHLLSSVRLSWAVRQVTFGTRVQAISIFSSLSVWPRMLHLFCGAALH